MPAASGRKKTSGPVAPGEAEDGVTTDSGAANARAASLVGGDVVASTGCAGACNPIRLAASTTARSMRDKGTSKRPFRNKDEKGGGRLFYGGSGVVVWGNHNRVRRKRK